VILPLVYMTGALFYGSIIGVGSDKSHLLSHRIEILLRFCVS